MTEPTDIKQIADELRKAADKLEEAANEQDESDVHEARMSREQTIDRVQAVLHRELPRLTWLNKRDIAERITDRLPTIVESPAPPRKIGLTAEIAEGKRQVELIRLLATSMASFIADHMHDSSEVARYIVQRLAPIATLAGMTPTLDAVCKDQRKLESKPPGDAVCAWCNVPESRHTLRHPFQAKTAPASVRAAASADKAVTTEGARCPRRWRPGVIVPPVGAIPAGARCTKPADGHPATECAFQAPGQLEREIKGKTLIAVDPAESRAGIVFHAPSNAPLGVLEALAARHGSQVQVMQRDAFTMPPEHYKPPAGFLPCTRPAPHTGPCAHPPAYGIGKAPWIGESLPDVPADPSGQDRMVRVMAAVARAVCEYELRQGKVPMTERTMDTLEDLTAKYLTPEGQRSPDVDIDVENAIDRASRTIRVRALGVQVKYPPKPTDFDLYRAARLGHEAAEAEYKPASDPNTGWPRFDAINGSEPCKGGCSRGGEGPMCGKPGCRG